MRSTLAFPCLFCLLALLAFRSARAALLPEQFTNTGSDLLLSQSPSSGQGDSGRSSFSLYQSEFTPERRHASAVSAPSSSSLSASATNSLSSRPGVLFSSLMSGNGGNNCVLGSATRDICERCAKVAKNEIAFPLCCANSEQVRDWCEEFLSYSLA